MKLLPYILSEKCSYLASEMASPARMPVVSAHFLSLSVQVRLGLETEVVDVTLRTNKPQLALFCDATSDWQIQIVLVVAI